MAHSIKCIPSIENLFGVSWNCRLCNILVNSWVVSMVSLSFETIPNFYCGTAASPLKTDFLCLSGRSNFFKFSRSLTDTYLVTYLLTYLSWLVGRIRSFLQLLNNFPLDGNVGPLTDFENLRMISQASKGFVRLGW
jgi:hypothetical protein